MDNWRINKEYFNSIFLKYVTYVMTPGFAYFSVMEITKNKQLK